MIHKVSIVIACYNDPDVVIAVESAIAQTYENKEIILVDDGSKKEIKEIINSLSERADLVITKKNGGQGSARNRGIEKATGEFILNLDSDDYFEKDFCEKAVDVFLKDNNVKIVTCHAKRFTKNGSLDIYYPKGGTIRDFLFSNSALGSSMFRKEDWKASGGYEESREMWGFEDWDLYLKLLKSGGYAYVLPEVLFNYQHREDSTTSVISHEREEKFKTIINAHKELYMSHFEEVISYFSAQLKSAHSEKIKKENSLEYRLGSTLLIPFKRLRNFFRNLQF